MDLELKVYVDLTKEADRAREVLTTLDDYLKERKRGGVLPQLLNNSWHAVCVVVKDADSKIPTYRCGVCGVDTTWNSHDDKLLCSNCGCLVTKSGYMISVGGTKLLWINDDRLAVGGHYYVNC
jgi:ArsR family metal-binding transcriptional regulator